jgi:hypothetical protein
MSAARRYTLTLLVSLSGLAIGLLAWSAPVLAAGPPAIGEEWSADVASNSATLEAQLSAEESETTYRFEYGTSIAYGSSLPVSNGSIGSGSSVVTVQVHPQSLLAGTEYHYRVVASNASGTSDGADHTFTTQSAGGAFALPDGREWEMVSPPNKHGAGIYPIFEEALQAAADGSGIAYAASGPVTGEAVGNRAPEVVPVLSRRVAGSWQTQDISMPYEAVAAGGVGGTLEYPLFSADLTLGVAEPRGETLLSPEATERTPYLRNDATGGYLPLATAANVMSGAKIGGDPELASGAVRVLSGTPDLSHLVLSSAVPLTNNAVGAGLYEWTAGKLELVSVLPGSSVAPSYQVPTLGGHGDDLRNAISVGGSRIVWEIEIETEVGGEKHLYLRDEPAGETVQVDAVQGGSGEGRDEPIFQTASSDGSKVFFTDSQQLTPGSKVTENQAPDLYEFELGDEPGKLAGTVQDLTPDKNPGELAEVKGVVMGASEDGSYVYFVANGVLAENTNATTGEKATPGHCYERSPAGATCNLYVSRNGITTFIASLDSEDQEWERLRVKGHLGQLPARVSPDGRFLAFMSDRSLTGYDNRDANSGQPDEEVYLYDALSGVLRCVSCDPTGARPVGVFDAGLAAGSRLLVDYEGLWAGRWVAGSIPGWTSLESFGQAFYQSRYLSNSGRLFFDSADALVPQDVNGVEDVYEYEPEGVGNCRETGGCVGLISSGKSGEESAFLDASESGSDVFFLTSARLVEQDYDHAPDVYDAHACSVAAPCAPGAVVVPPPCSTADSCRAAVTPQPGVFGPPASATFSGAGNLAPPISKPAVRPKKPKKARRAARRRKRRASVRRRVKKSGVERLVRKGGDGR